MEDGGPADDAGQDDMRAHFPMAFGKPPDRLLFACMGFRMQLPHCAWYFCSTCEWWCFLEISQCRAHLQKHVLRHAERGCAAAAGAQEPERVRLDSVHAATVRGAGADAAPIPQADAGAGFVARAADGGAALAAPRGPNPSNGRYSNGAAAGPMPLLEGDGAAEWEPDIGPVLPEGLGSGLGEEDEEDDPWRLPITHEVAFEGACCESRAYGHAVVRSEFTASVRPFGCCLASTAPGLQWHLMCRAATVSEPEVWCILV